MALCSGHGLELLGYPDLCQSLVACALADADRNLSAWPSIDPRTSGNCAQHL